MPVVIPELVYVVGLFFAIVGYLAARGLLATWTHSVGYVLKWLASEFTFAINLGFKTVHVDLGGPFRAVDHFAITALQNWCDGAEIEIGYCLHGMEKVARFTAEMVDRLARGTSQTFDWMLRVHLPRWARWAVAAVLPFGLIVKLVRGEIAKLRPQILRTVRTVEHTITHTITRVVVKTAAIAIPGAVALPGLRKEVTGLTKRWARINARLRKVEALFGVAAMAVAMANVLGLPNWRCLTRGNIGRLARHICGLPAHVLDDLLGLLVDVVIVTDICKVIELLTAGLSIIEGPLQTFVSVTEGALCHGDYSAPPKIPTPALSLPPVSGLELSLA